MSNIAEFAEIPEYSVTDNMTLEDVNNLVTEIYTRNYKAVNGTTPPLHSADPITLTLKSISELYYMVLQVAEKRTRCALLKTATGAALDNMGLPFGVKRNEATYATVTIRFNLSAEQKTVVMIPQGTRVRTAAGIYFATAAYAQIAIGETYVDVLAQAEVVGASGNDVPIGVVDTLVDAIPYVAAVENVDTSSGGADAESDDSLTRRIWLSPTTYSCAGPRDAYEYWAMSFRSDVENAIAVSPRSQPCTVYIFFMLTGGRMPSEKDMSEMQAYLMNEARRPMTDQVICKAPEEVEYVDISGKADKAKNATAGNFAALDGEGNLTDSGKKPADFVAAETGKRLMTNAEGEKLKGISAGATKTAASETNGHITIDGVDTTVYTEPSDVIHGTVASDEDVTAMLTEVFGA